MGIRGRAVGDGVLSIGLRLVGGVWRCPANMIDDEYVICACSVCAKNQFQSTWRSVEKRQTRDGKNTHILFRVSATSR